LERRRKRMEHPRGDKRGSTETLPFCLAFLLRPFCYAFVLGLGPALALENGKLFPTIYSLRIGNQIPDSLSTQKRNPKKKSLGLFIQGSPRFNPSLLAEKHRLILRRGRLSNVLFAVDNSKFMARGEQVQDGAIKIKKPKPFLAACWGTV